MAVLAGKNLWLGWGGFGCSAVTLLLLFRVDVKEFQIQVQGTVIARGTSQNKIVFTTTGDRNSWLYYPHGLPHLFSFYRNASLEEQNQTNSMIENAIISEPIDVFASNNNYQLVPSKVPLYLRINHPYCPKMKYPTYTFLGAHQP